MPKPRQHRLPDVCEAVADHERSVPAGADPIREAFAELVAGPTADEAEGAFSFFSSETKNTVRSMTIDDGMLTVDFDDLRAELTPTGANTSFGSGLLLAELNSTAFQFDTVDSVRYELEGSCDEFGEWLQRGCIELSRAEWADLISSLPPRQPIDAIVGPGAVFGVIGVAVDDQLNVRARPGADQAIVDSLDPLTTGLVYTGRARHLGPPTSVWYEVQAGEVSGWVHARFVAPLSATFDITNEIVEVEGGLPTGATIDEIGATVLEVRSRFADPRPSSILVDGPTPGDPTEVTYDLIGFGDDSVLGERLHLSIARAENGVDRLELQRVEATFLCARGSGTGTDLCP